MPARNHPNEAPGIPVLLGPGIDRWFFRYLNPAMKWVSRYLPTGTSVIEHRGRKSGKPYQTVVSAYRRGGLLAVALGHGNADWVKNVMAAGGADVRTYRTRVRISNPRILPVGTSDRTLPFLVQLQARRAAILVADIA